ncbi:MAG: trypsin-like serine peptidase [Janthinobacterium lividum]
MPLRPGVGAVDRRMPVDVNAMPWSSLVRVQTELGERCTGFLVSPQVVVTAAHCLFLPRVRRFIQPSSVHVLRAYRNGQYAAHAMVVRFTVPPSYQPLDETRTAGADRAVLVLDRRLLPESETLPEAPVPAVLPAPILLGGYGQDRNEVAIADRTCRLVGQAGDGEGRPLLVHDCEATRGTSGAPLLWRRPDGRWAAIGIQIEAASGAGGRAVPLVGMPGPATGSDNSAGR